MSNIHHTVSTVTIFATDNYKQFSMINGNRGLNENKIKKIIKEVESGNDMLKYYPIQVRVVGESLEILDGQHRFFICKKLKRQVHYILVTEDKSMPDIAKVNSNVEKWASKDFINCYINQGNEHYIKLQEFLNLTKISVGLSLRLLSSGNPGVEGFSTKITDDFQQGAFTVTHWNDAIEMFNECKKFNSFQYFIDRSFIIALYRIKKAGLITMDDLATAVNKNPEKLIRNANQKQYIYNLEQIVNIGKQKRIVII